MFKHFLLFIASLVIITACTENNTTNVVGTDKTLVLITDNDANSETSLSIIGAVRKEYPNVDIQYIKTNDFDISSAGYVLEYAAQKYPDDTYFAVIVDPGRNTNMIVLQSGNRRIFAPDNGVTTRFRQSFTTSAMNYVSLSNILPDNQKGNTNISYNEFVTYATLSLLSKTPVSQFGEVCTEPIDLEITAPKFENGVAIGEILYIDNFGNCVSNLGADIANNFKEGDILEISGEFPKFYAKFGTGYSSVDQLENVVVFNGNGKIELATNYGNISNKYNLVSGTKISIKLAKIKAGIIRYNASTLSNNIVAGLKLSLEQQGFIAGKNIEYFEKNVNSDISQFYTVIQELLDEGIDIAIPVSTPASKAANEYIPSNIPIVYTYVTSPEFAGLVGSRANITGLSDATNFDDYLGFVKELFPNSSTAGRIYNPDEPNSAFSQNEFVKYGPKYSLQYISEEVHSEQEISSAFNNLKNQKFDALLIAADNTLNLGMKDLASLAINNKIPLIGDSEENTEDGALASISVDYDLLATASGNIIKTVLLGKPTQEIPIQRFNSKTIILNNKTAKAISFEFSPQIINKASKIIE